MKINRQPSFSDKPARKLRARCAWLLLILLGIFPALLWILPQSSPGHAASSNEFMANEVVVKLASTADLQGVASTYGLDPTPISQFGSRPIYRLRITDGVAVSQKVTQLLADPQLRVVYAEPNYIVKAPEATKDSWSVGDSFSAAGDFAAYNSQWATQTIQLPIAHQVTRGAGITVAVLDTGVDANHPALVGHLVPGYDFVDMDNDPSEVGSVQQGPYGHGTHVAGLIALVAPDAKIMPIRVLDQNGAGNIWVLAEALAYAVDPDHNPATHDGANVISLSLSTQRQTNLLKTLLTKVCSDTPQPGDDDFPTVGNDNVVVIAAAGNTGDTTLGYPAAENINGLLGVGASTETDSLALFSTRGSWVRVVAPGTNIISSVPAGKYGTWNGTSMATPIVAGEAALVRAAFPGLRQTKIIDQIVRTSQRIQGPIQARIDIGAAVTTQPEATPTPTSTPTPTPIATPTPSPTPSPTPTPGTVQFSAASYNVSEGAGAVTITVTRLGDVSQAASVNYATSDSAGLAPCTLINGLASERCDYATSIGTLRWAAGDATSKSFIVPVIDDYHLEGTETFSVTLSSPVGVRLGTQASATIAISDNGNDSPGAQNPIDDPSFFITEQYSDFL